MASGVYLKGLQHLTNGDIDWDGDTIKAMLTKNTYDHTPTAAETYEYLDDVSGNRASGTTDATMGTHGYNEDTTNNELEFTAPATPTTWTSVAGSQTVDGCVIYYDSGTPSTSPLIVWDEFSTPVVCNGSDVEVTWDTEGFFKISYYAGD